MTFEAFEARAREEWDRIPEQYRAGVDGLVVDRKARRHPSLPEVYTLGECVTESYPSDFGGPDTTRSMVVLYYGSFWRLSRLDDGFDWEHELWETLTHELQHHLESLAAEDGLLDVDYAADEHFRRLEGEAFDAFYFRHGTARDGWHEVEGEHFQEQPMPPAGEPVRFSWNGAEYRLEAAGAADADVVYVEVVDGVPDAPPLHIVLVRQPSFRDAVRSLFRSREPRVVELESAAHALGGSPRRARGQ